MPKRMGYLAAIAWIANNDDCEWLDDDDGAISVTVVFCADLFGYDPCRVRRDLARYIIEMGL